MSESREERLNKIAHDLDKSRRELKIKLKILFALDNTADDTPEWKLAYSDTEHQAKYYQRKIERLEDDRELLTQVEEVA
jgi:hypothetical protein